MASRLSSRSSSRSRRSSAPGIAAGYFTASNVPAGLLTAPDGWTLEQIKELQEWLNQLISGNIDAQRQLLWTPHGTEYKSFKDAPIKDEFDEWLARVVAFAFSLPPTPFIRQMNKGTAGEDQERALEEGLEPLKLWRQRWLTELIATEFDAPDLEFVFAKKRQSMPPSNPRSTIERSATARPSSMKCAIAAAKIRFRTAKARGR
jgi:hypothetical protein